MLALVTYKMSKPGPPHAKDVTWKLVDYQFSKLKNLYIYTSLVGSSMVFCTFPGCWGLIWTILPAPTKATHKLPSTSIVIPSGAPVRFLGSVVNTMRLLAVILMLFHPLVVENLYSILYYKWFQFERQTQIHWWFQPNYQRGKISLMGHSMPLH